MRGALAFIFWLFIFPATAQFVLTPGSNIAGSSAQCPFGTGGLDKCGVSPGLFYSPAATINSDGLGRPNPTTKPTAAQWEAYAATSGQTWTSTHPQTWNVACVDFGCGPSIALSSTTDIAGWNAGIYTGSTTNPVATGCVYMSAADGYNGTTGAGWTGTASSSGTTLTLVSTATGALAVGMQLIPPGDPSVAALTLVIDNPGGGNTFTLNRSFTHAAESLSATNTYFGAGTSTFGWVQSYPALLCSVPSSTNFNITGWNFAETAFQDHPVGSHTCVNLLFQAIGTSNPAINVTNNAFINGATCAPLIGGTRNGQITSPGVNLYANVKIWNNYFWGRNTNACCIIPGNQGYPMTLSAMRGNLDIEFNWMYQTGSGAGFNGWVTGSETAVASCSNGTAYSFPGYTYIYDDNYNDNFGTLYGGGHYELMNLGGLVAMCLVDRSYNTIVMPSTMPAEVEGSFFGWASTGQGVVEKGVVSNNTVVTNMTGGRQTPAFTSATVEHYNWHTNAGTPNLFVLDGPGTSCPSYPSFGGICPGPTTGQGLTGGTNNTANSGIGLQGVVSGSPGVVGETLAAGCNAQDSPPTICTVAGNYPSLTAGVTYPSNAQPSVLNSAFVTYVAGQALVEYDHGNLGYQTTFAAAAAGGPWTGSGSTPVSIGTTLTTCLTGTVGTGATNGAYEGAMLIDNSQSNIEVGMIYTCTGSPATLTVVFNTGVTVQVNDNLTLASFGYGVTIYHNNFIDITGAQQYYGANPVVNSTGGASGYSTAAHAGAGGCAVAVDTGSGATQNIDLVTGSAATFGSRGPGC